MAYSHETRKRAPAPVYLATSVVIFVLSFSAADSIGFVPCELDATCERYPFATLSDFPELGPLENDTQSGTFVTTRAARVTIPAIDLDIELQHPHALDEAVLDGVLVNGPAVYPGSAELGATGDMRTVILYGHSSRLPVVRNEMYRIFNRIPELEAGDAITLTGENGVRYVYHVSSIRQADVNTYSDNFFSPSQKLIIVTCDNFTGKSARFILEADFVAAF